MQRLVLRIIYGVIVLALSGVLWRVTNAHNQPLPVATTTTTVLVTSTTSPRVTPPTTTPPPTSIPPTPVTSATSQTLAPLASGELDGLTVTIDPGHNGGNAQRPDVINRLVPDGRGTKACDTTGTATSNGFPESTFTFALAHAVAVRLQQRGATVVLTRSNNVSVGPCVNERAAIGNSSDVGISLHGDGGPSSGRGFTILTPTDVGPSRVMTSQSNRLAGILRNHLTRGGFVPSNYIGVNGIQPRSDLAGLNLSTTPKVFLECANMKNPSDAVDLQSSLWRDRLATAVADALATFLLSRS